ncbi:tyrosine-type recombinase/integrase [Planctomicrobium sp. SH668]|uniref:tyrosine-type recombinase/integrase n=1 Tax=Planctomicrobium sp. SH668 TaxID=3448126 RepID=UPI003F5BCDDF
MNSKKSLKDSSELSSHTYADCHNICQAIVDHFGREYLVQHIFPVDFEKFRKVLSHGVNKVTLKNRVNRARGVFNYAFENGLIDRPVRYGAGFDRPSEKLLRREKNRSPERYLDRDEILAVLDASDPSMRAMVLLGANCGFGNTDVASLPISAIDFKGGWVIFPRPKTEVPRRVPLWEETMTALKVVIGSRPKPKDPSDYEICFITGQGNRWMRSFRSRKNPSKLTTVNTVSQNFSATMKRAGIDRRRVSFYALRHVFETIGGESRDQVAVDFIMGHAPKSNDMASQYRHGISDERLRVVVNTVHRHLWPNLF